MSSFARERSKARYALGADDSAHRLRIGQASLELGDGSGACSFQPASRLQVQGGAAANHVLHARTRTSSSRSRQYGFCPCPGGSDKDRVPSFVRVCRSNRCPRRGNPERTSVAVRRRGEHDWTPEGCLCPQRNRFGCTGVDETLSNGACFSQRIGATVVTRAERQLSRSGSPCETGRRRVGARELPVLLPPHLRQADARRLLDGQARHD